MSLCDNFDHFTPGNHVMNLTMCNSCNIFFFFQFCPVVQPSPLFQSILVPRDVYWSSLEQVILNLQDISSLADVTQMFSKLSNAFWRRCTETVEIHRSDIGCCSLIGFDSKPIQTCYTLNGLGVPSRTKSAVFFNIVLLYYSSFLLSKALFILEQFIYFVASTFKPNGSLSSTDEKQEKSNYKAWKSESNFAGALISSPKVHLPINQAHLSTFTFTSYQLPVFASLSKSPGSQIKCCVWNWMCSTPPGLLEEKSRPPSHLHPPGLHLPGFHLPSSSPCHQEVAGRGYLQSRSQ